jgi:hypothetical protein
VHVVESLVDVVQTLVVGNKLVDPKSAVQVVYPSAVDLHTVRMTTGRAVVGRRLTIDDTWDLGSSLDSTESRSSPNSTSN